MRRTGLYAITAALAVISLAPIAPALDHQVADLYCEGEFYGYQSEIRGQRAYAPFNALGDGQVRFDGQIRNSVGTARLVYQGYTRTAAFEGLVVNRQIQLGVAVLDATGAGGQQMLIYDSAPSLGAPQILGSFLCSWS